MKGAARFCIDWLVEDKDGYLVVVPSTSPENDFKYGNDQKSGISVATTMDMSIIWDLFTNLIDASAELNTDKAFHDLLVAKKAKLYPLHIGQKGNLQEWNKDWEDVDPRHRHVSHLFGLYPGRQIAPVSTPEFAAAAKKTLEIRGDEGTGWSKAWKINFWARLLDGDHAHLLLQQLLKYTSQTSTNYSRGGGTYPNFFDAHPPFQIDGNFGGTAGIAEMLLQSHLGEIHLLPALPATWKDGEVKGLKARGNYTVSVNWKNHRLTTALITSVSGGACKIRTAERVIVKELNIQSKKDRDGYVISFNSQKGKTYHFSSLGSR
jgi:alpha-L-fucosidase 2